jgi:CRISPR/Cas system-associated endonuclease/helicase Cas3
MILADFMMVITSLHSSVSHVFLLEDPCWHQKITTDAHFLFHTNITCPDDRYPKLNIYTSELILDSYKYIPVVYITIRCII